MNDDVLEVLRRADPALDRGGYDDDRVAQQVALIVRSQAGTEQEARMPRRRNRRWGVPVAAFLAVAGAGLATAAAAGWLTPQARQTFDSPDVRQSLLQLYGTTADLDKARERVTAPGPDGSTVSTWTVPVGDKGTCTAILVSKKSAKLPGGDSGRMDRPVACEDVPGPRVIKQRPRITAAVQWRSHTSGDVYWLFGGPQYLAVRVQLQLADGTRLPATTRDGYFLLPPVPVAKITCAALVGFDRGGHQVGQASYLSLGCPGDRYQPGLAPTPAPPGSTVTEKEQTQAVVYDDDDIGVNVAAVIKQDPARGAGSSIPGMSLITVQLQFFGQPSSRPESLPTSVSFDLLFGDQHQAAAKDAGKHNDPDLSGVFVPPGGWMGEKTWWPQLSFDVPTDQLAKLQVRINGDGTHPTIVFSSVRVTQ
jgi:hypothetical protein